MLKPTRIKSAVIGLLMLSASFAAPLARAEDAIEKAGVAVGLTLGNLLFLPIKAIAVSMGLLSGALSAPLSGGNIELSKQIWQDTTEGPYVITPEVAKQGVGERPELQP
jgi:hypothetical protein